MIRTRGWPQAAIVVLVAAVLVVTPAPASTARPDPPRAAGVTALPPTGVDWDYQLGGDRPVPDRVGVVVRDRRSEPVAGLYNVCYVNGFQTQPDEKRFWRDRWRLVLKRDGRPVVDGAWGEWLLDIGTTAKRRALARIVGRWTGRCAEDGFDAVEFDNLDSFTRSRGLLTPPTPAASPRGWSAAPTEGLAAAQKNRARGTARPSATTSPSPSSAPSTASARVRRHLRRARAGRRVPAEALPPRLPRLDGPDRGGAPRRTARRRRRPPVVSRRLTISAGRFTTTGERSPRVPLASNVARCRGRRSGDERT